MRCKDYKLFEDRGLLAQGFIDYFKAQVLSHEGPFYLALSGGSTPDTVFEALAKLEDHDWLKQVYFFWGDERMVPHDHQESNYGRAYQLLFCKCGIAHEQIFPIKFCENAQESAGHYEALLRDKLPCRNGELVFDMVLLGLGEDGHTASIFPHEQFLWDSPHCCVVGTHPATGQQRVSLTGRVINRADRVVFLVSGIGKSQRVKELFEEDERAKNYPASLVCPKSGNLIWFMDKEAAGLLPSSLLKFGV